MIPLRMHLRTHNEQTLPWTGHRPFFTDREVDAMKLVQALFAMLMMSMILLASCAHSADHMTDTKAPEDVKQAITPSAPQDDVSQVGSDLNTVDSIDQDLDTSDLDSVDKGLSDLDW